MFAFASLCGIWCPYQPRHIAAEEEDWSFTSLKLSINTVCKEKDTQLNGKRQQPVQMLPLKDAQV